MIDCVVIFLVVFELPATLLLCINDRWLPRNFSLEGMFFVLFLMSYCAVC